MPDNRDEKEEEKKYEKEEEKREEKSFDEKWRHNPLGSAIWALILMWAGVVLLAFNMGWLAGFEQLNAWGLIALGAGLLLLAEVLVRLILPEYRRPVVGTLILAVVFLSIGLQNSRLWNVIWPLLLIGAGVVVLLGYFGRRE